DGRFVVSNGPAFDIRIEKRGSTAPPKTSETLLPKSAVKRAAATGPVIFAAEDASLSRALPAAISLVPYFAPFDRFLTRFDFIFAQRLAAAFGTRPYPTPPLGLIDGKTT